MKILLVEDNPSIVKGLDYAFTQEGYEVISVYDIESAKELLEKENFQLAILDISLPDGDGISLYKNIVKKLEIPTVLLTAKDDEETIVECLTLGAEDYITKPFRTKELLVRIDKIIKRKNKNTIIKVQDISFDIDKMVVYRADTKLELTSLELKILHLLFININKVVTRSKIIDKVWEWTGNDIEDNTVTVYMKRIRQKLKTDIIVTLKGIGYRIDADGK